MPTFAIITPVFNGIHFLRGMRNALEKQTVKDFEWIIINDGSNDATPKDYEKILEGLSFPKKIFHIENVGQGMARNIGISESIAPWICTIDVDDIPYANKIETIMQLIENYSEKQAIIGAHALIIVGKNRRIAQFIVPFAFSNDNKTRIVEIKKHFKRTSNPFPASGVFFSRRLLDATGIKYLEDRKLIGTEDYIFNMTALKVADEIVVTDKVCGTYLEHANNISKPTFGFFQKTISALVSTAEDLDFKEELPWAIANICILNMFSVRFRNRKFVMDMLNCGVKRGGLFVVICAFFQILLSKITSFCKTLKLNYLK
jgi:glycosyltransferase involved in cell wall biosynthesis